MRMKVGALARIILVLGLLSGWLGACSGGGNSEQAMTDFVKNYGAVVYANYQAVETGLKALQESVNKFVDSPSKAGLDDAKKKWLEVRDVYGQTEVFRFYGGPVDDDRGYEGRMNAWPLDENFIDYVDGEDKAGIVNDKEKYPTIDEKTLSELNEKENDKTISIGFHAIEFLLWGQDVSPTSPGTRPYTDYVESQDGPGVNAKRRGTYLKVVTALLLSDLQKVMEDWKPGVSGNYRDKMEKGDPKEALQKILTGMGVLSGGELSGERMTTPYKEKDQEEEHSCFSDNTKADILNNALGVQNVFLGKFGSVTGASLDALVRAQSAEVADKLKKQLEASVAAIKEIPNPFDQAILGDDSASGRQKVKAAIEALQAQAQTIAEVGKLFGLTINTDIPE